MRQEKLLNGTDWDVLIILDACRYDYFEKIYPKYLKGDLKKVISPASNTMEWCMKVVKTGIFSDDVIVSANPHINSRMSVGKRKFEPYLYFDTIEDAWAHDWDEKLNTVPPWRLLKYSDIVNKGERVIFWFIQPHAPYLHEDAKRKNSFPRKANGSAMNVGGEEKNILGRVMEAGIKKLFPPQLLQLIYTARFRIKKDQLGPLRQSLVENGLQGLRDLYKENLEAVLTVCSSLINKWKDVKVVITADHGELLGDRILGHSFVHPAGQDYPKLHTVPWLEVEK